MCDDIHKQFFRSHVYYYESLGLFFELIGTLVSNKKEAAEVLMEYDCLIDIVVQSLFWRTHRPDIMQELTLADLRAIEADARFIIDNFIVAINGHERVYDDRAKNFFKVMATTPVVSNAFAPVVSNAFDPNNEAIFLSNVATLMKSEETFLKTWSWMDCINENVISSVITLFASTTKSHLAVHVVEITFNVICERTGEWIGDQGDKPLVAEDDERFAAAINSGLITACLTMLQRFVGRSEYTELLDGVHNLLDLLSAIDNNRGIITEALQTFEKSLSGYKEVKILQLVKSTLFIMDHCIQCAKVLQKKDVAARVAWLQHTALESVKWSTGDRTRFLQCRRV
jgi:hypothetical protein